MNTKRILAVAALLVLALPAVRAQEKPPAPPPPPPRPSRVVPLKVQVVFSEYDGDRKVSSLPYVLNHNAETGRESRTSMRMGIRVPISTPAANPTAQQITYQSVGTDIDCFVRTEEDGSFRATFELRRSSLYTPGPDTKQIEWKPNDPAVPGNPFFREFSGRVDAMLRDGQTIQTTVATDPVSGRILKVDVTLTVIK
ncbi:MAG: hypothetical protein HY046_13905 [Acidobacteria bacterium]|nr:hypothetical protein [Acidobacteriota bacterium]